MQPFLIEIAYLKWQSLLKNRPNIWLFNTHLHILHRVFVIDILAWIVYNRWILSHVILSILKSSAFDMFSFLYGIFSV